MVTVAKISPEAKRRLEARLRGLPEDITQAARGALEKNAEELISMQRRFAPADQGELRDSIRAIPSEDNPRTPTRGGVLATRGLSFDIVARWYWRFLEFGTSKQPAQPFAFPAYRALRKRMKSRVSRAVGKALRERRASNE